MKKLLLILFGAISIAGCGGMSPEEACYVPDPTDEQRISCLEYLQKTCIECCMDPEIWEGEEGSLTAAEDKETCESYCSYEPIGIENANIWRVREFTSDMCSGPQITFG